MKEKFSNFTSKHKWWISPLVYLLLLPFVLAFYNFGMLCYASLPEANLILDSAVALDSYEVIAAVAVGFSSFYALGTVLGFVFEFSHEIVEFFKHLFYKKHEEKA